MLGRFEVAPYGASSFEHYNTCPTIPFPSPQVKVTHPYTGQDEDELTLETDDIINVIPYEDPEEQVPLCMCPL